MNEIRRPFSQNPSGCIWDRCGYYQRDNIGTNITNVNPESVANQFVSEYYRKVSNIGWNTVVHMFDQNCIVNIKNKNIGNSHNMLNFLSSEYIKRANYDNLRVKWFVIEKNKLLINVFGQIQFVTFGENVSKITTFTETFILTGKNNGDIKCTYHLIDF